MIDPAATTLRRSLAVALTIGAAMLLPSPALASEAKPRVDKSEFCTRISATAEGAMRQRQGGVSIIDAIKSGDSLPPADQATHLEIVKEAYAEPSYMTEPMQRRTVTDFGARFYLGCMQAVAKL